MYEVVTIFTYFLLKYPLTKSYISEILNAFASSACYCFRSQLSLSGKKNTPNMCTYNSPKLTIDSE